MTKKQFPYQAFEEYLEVLLAQDEIFCWESKTKGQYLVNEELEVWPKNKKYHDRLRRIYGRYNHIVILIRKLF